MPAIHRAIGLIIIFACGVIGNAAAAAEERWFTIELLIFKNGGSAWKQEDWHPNPQLYYPEPLLVSSALASPLETDMPTKELEFNGKLADAAEKLTASGQYRVLYSRRWQQGLVKTTDAPYLLITGGNPYGSHYELEGSIRFSVDRYLHANANLWFTTFGDPLEHFSEPLDQFGEPLEQQNEPVDPTELYENDNDAWQGNDEIQAGESGYLADENGYQANEDDWFELEEGIEEDFEEPMALPNPPWESDYTGPQSEVIRVVTLNQQRRLRSRETHYIDHPSFGILIRIEPVPDASNGED